MRVKCDKVSVNSFSRLGRRQEVIDAKPRPAKMTPASEGQKRRSTSPGKKLERQEGQRIRQGLYPSGLDAKATSEKKGTSAGAKGKTVTGRKESNDPWRQNRGG